MNRKITIKRIFSYTKNYRGYFIVSIILAAITVATTLTVPILIGKAIDGMIGRGNVEFEKISLVIGQIGILVAITATSQWLMNISNNIIVYGITKDLRDESMEKISRLPIRFFDKTAYGDIVSRVIADVDQFGDGLLLGFTQGFTGLMTLAGTVIFMFSVNIKMTIIVLVSTPLALLIAAFISKNSYKMFQMKNASRGETTALMEEAISGENVIQAFGMEDKAIAEFDVLNKQLEVYSRKGTFLSSLPNPSTRFVYALIYAALTCGGAYLVIHGQITVGLMTSFLGYATQFTKPFNEMTDVTAQMQNAISCAGRMFDLIDEDIEVPDEPNAVDMEEPDGRVEFKDVEFSYVQDKRLIEDFNLRVEPGQRVAIVGPTGCGKTTLINLLMRFYDVNSGSISISGIDIRNIKRRSLRNCFGMVLQDTWLSNGTIRDNIAMGMPDATDEEVEEAARDAYADGFIRKLKDGYNTRVNGEAGGLSQGQKQLLCIARIMLVKPKMLILDEATSSIDARTEVKIQAAFDKLMSGRTSFIVAHRLSTIQNADIILVMKDGKIIEKGNHRELLALGGFYNNLYNSQFHI